MITHVHKNQQKKLDKFIAIIEAQYFLNFNKNVLNSANAELIKIVNSQNHNNEIC